MTQSKDKDKAKSIPVKNVNNACSSRWLSKGLETLITQLDELADPDKLHFDLVIVGSGYGGAMAAAELAGCLIPGADGQPSRPARVCILERGEEYLPGMFPKNASELPGHVRFSTPEAAAARGKRNGLFDLRLNGDVSTLLANGLGGGSLINAGVMERPDTAVFTSPSWPLKIQNEAKTNDLKTWFQEAEYLLGASQRTADSEGEQKNSIEDHADHRAEPLKKFSALHALGKACEQKADFSAAAISTAMGSGKNSAGVDVAECLLCGDCATGCNFNAKNSLDCNLLATARRNGAKIYSGASVAKITPQKSDAQSAETWQLQVNYTDPKLSYRQGEPVCIHAGKVILAAGSLGSTELLMRSRSKTFPLSHKLGARFSSNGDMIAVNYQHDDPVNAVANQEENPKGRRVGPTITGKIDYRTQQSKGFVVEELAVPGPLAQFFCEMVTTLDCLDALGKVDDSTHVNDPDMDDPQSVSSDKILRTSVYAIMGDDGADGSLYLPEPKHCAESEGTLGISWPELKKKTIFSDQIEVLENLVSTSKVGGKVLANGLWKPLSDDMMSYLGEQGNGPLFTVHPLGGCVMADSIQQGVVNDLGQLFKPSEQNTNDIYETLMVLDGAIIPSSLGINPALTIATISLRASRKLRQKWEWQDAEQLESKQQPVKTWTKRPFYRDTRQVLPAKKTKLSVTERLSGPIVLMGKNYQLELTLNFAEKALVEMCKPFSLQLETAATEIKPDLKLKPSTLRIFDSKTYADLAKQYQASAQYEQLLDENAMVSATLGGELKVFHRAASRPEQRLANGVLAFLRNRGLRDAWQAMEKWSANGFKGESGNATKTNKSKPFRQMFSLASHAGEVRLFDYDLSILEITKQIEDANLSSWLKSLDSSRKITGFKRLTYEYACNPWRQMSEMSVSQFPGWTTKIPPLSLPRGHKLPVLSLDTKYLARIGVPLVQLSDQENHAQALYDVASLGLYITRLVVWTHLWTFRLPDEGTCKRADRFPGKIAEIPDPVVKEIDVDRTQDGQAVKIRLTRYPRYQSEKPAIIMIHGYSVSGNTFTHPQVNPNLASYFWKQGRDVWILDLRTSSAMLTAEIPWRFEDVAFADIPIAFDYVHRNTQYKKIDVLAHCMGAAMFSMAILSAGQDLPDDFENRLLSEEDLSPMREKLPELINRAAFSQIGPVPVFSPANIFRGFLLNYYIHYIKSQHYSFQRSDKPSLLENLFDRLLYSMPYPEEEFALENPLAPWAKRRFVATRHRMDALYGRDFNLKNIEPKLYDYFDDLFGPLSLGTVSQVLHFSRYSMLTSHKGVNRYVSRENFQQHWRFPSYSFHGSDNGLVDPVTKDRMDKILKLDALRQHTSEIIPGYGHQDCLIGKGRVKAVYDKLRDFYNGEYNQGPVSEVSGSTNDEKRLKNKSSALSQHEEKLVAHYPFIGPLREPANEQIISIRVQTGPVYTQPDLLVHVPVVKRNGRVERLQQERPFSEQGFFSFTLPDVAAKFGNFLRDGWHRVNLPRYRIPQKAEGIVSLYLSPESPWLSQINFSQKFEPSNFFELSSLVEFILMGQHRLNVSKQGAQNYVGAVEKALERIFAQQLGLERQTIWFPKSNESDELATNQRRFAVASCQYPSGLLDRKVAAKSFQKLLDIHREEGVVDGVLLLGDQIYADSTAGLFDAYALHDRYIRPTERFWQIQPLQELAKETYIHTMLDDHEIDDNYEPNSSENGEQFRTNGIKAFLHYQRGDFTSGHSGKHLHEKINVGGIPVFMANTRTNRQARKASSVQNSEIMGGEDSDQQLCDLREFLTKHKLKSEKEQEKEQGKDEHQRMPCLIASPSAVLPRRLEAMSESEQYASAIRSDAWDGYPGSLSTLLAFIYDNNIQDLVFISGDHHISSATKAILTREDNPREVTIYSIHSSGLYSPLPFANDVAECFAAADDWSFSAQKKDECELGFNQTELSHYRCRAQSTFYPGDGFAYITVSHSNKGWELSCRFEKTDDEVAQVFTIKSVQDKD